MVEEEREGGGEPPPRPGREVIVQAVRRPLRRLQREEKNRRKSRQRHENDRLPEADHIHQSDSTGGERIPGDAFMMERNWSARSGSTGRTSRLHASAWSGEGMRAANAGAA